MLGIVRDSSLQKFRIGGQRMRNQGQKIGYKTLKVVGNEKYGGSRFLQLLGISLGPWRSTSIFILNVPFAIEKCISFSVLSRTMNRRFV